MKDVYLSRTGRQVAEEQVRQACLWDVLTNGREASASAQWWDYKRRFLRRCHLGEEDGGFDRECSEQVGRNTGLSDEDTAAWKECWAELDNPDRAVTIGPAEEDLQARVEENVPWYLKTFVTVNFRHYHGLFDRVRRPRPPALHSLVHTIRAWRANAVRSSGHELAPSVQAHVYRAACQGMHVPSSDPICGSEVAAGFCAPGTTADLTCRNQVHVDARRTVCFDGSSNNQTSGCHCDPGWQPDGAQAARGEEQDGACVDVNECIAEDGDPCLQVRSSCWIEWISALPAKSRRSETCARHVGSPTSVHQCTTDPCVYETVTLSCDPAHPVQTALPHSTVGNTPQHRRLRQGGGRAGGAWRERAACRVCQLARQLPLPRGQPGVRRGGELRQLLERAGRRGDGVRRQHC